MAIEIHTGVVPGRIVWGNPAKSKNKTRRNPVTNAEEVVMGPDGTPAQQWAFGVAFPKDHFQQNIYPALAQEAATAFPNGVPPRFAWKFKDGDGVDSKGQPFSSREGHAGHYVLTVSTEAFAPPIYKLVNGVYQQLQPDQIKCGDYVALGLVIKYNGATGTNTPGLYVNPQAIELVGYGTEIVSAGSVDPNAVFGGKQYQLPAGATLQPMVAQGGAAMPGMTQTAGMPMQQPQGMPQMGQPAMQPMSMPGNGAGMPMGANPAVGYPSTQTQPGQPGGFAAQTFPSNDQMPPPAHDFVQNAMGQPAMQPQMQPGQPMMQQPQGMPGQMPMGMPGFPQQ